jgi:hypothetical protein
MHLGYWWESQKERDHWEGQDVRGWVKLKWILRGMKWGGMGWIDSDEDNDQWRALVNTVMNIRVP